MIFAAAPEVTLWAAIIPTFLTVAAGTWAVVIQSRQKSKSDRLVESASLAAVALDETKVVIAAWQQMVVQQGEHLLRQDTELTAVRHDLTEQRGHFEACQKDRGDLLERVEAMAGVIAGYNLWPKDRANPDK